MRHSFSFLVLQLLVFASTSQSLPVSVKLVHLGLKDSEQWLINEQHNEIVSCSIDIPLLCIYSNLIQIKQTITLFYDNKLYDFSNDNHWSTITKIKRSVSYDTNNSPFRRRLEGLGLLKAMKGGGSGGGLGLKLLMKGGGSHLLQEGLRHRRRRRRRRRRRCRRRRGCSHELFDGLIGRTRDDIIRMRMRKGLCVNTMCGAMGIGMNQMNPMIRRYRRLIDIDEEDVFIIKKCVMNENMICLVYNYYDGTVSVDYSVINTFNGKWIDIFDIGYVESNEWIISDLDVTLDYQCNSDLGYNGVCFKQSNLNDNDIIIVIKRQSNDSSKDIVLSLIEETNWSVILYINNDIKLLCHNISKTCKLCVEFKVNLHVKLNKISIENVIV